MPRAERWSQLTVGILAFLGVAAVASAVLLFARIGALHGDTTRIYTVTDMATGVRNGTDVWFGGQKVGLVKGVTLRPPASDTTERVAIAMDILTEYLGYLRKDSDIQIRPGGNLIGAPVVSITGGSPAAALVQAGDTLRARAQIEGRPGIADVSSLGDSVSAIGSEFKQIDADLDRTEGIVGSVGARTEHQIAEVQRAMARFSHRATRSRGTIAMSMRDTARLRAQVGHIAAVADSIGAAAAGRGDIGRFRHDSTLVAHASDALASVDTLRRRMGRFSEHPTSGDSALAKELNRVHVLLDSLVHDAKSHPFRYIAL